MTRELPFAFPLSNGLHARPASLVSKAASRFLSGMVLANRTNGLSGNAKSALALVATLTRHGDACTLAIEGEDEMAAAEAMERFLSGDLPQSEEKTVAPVPTQRGTRPLPRALVASGALVHHGTPVSGGIGRAPALVVDAWQALPDPAAVAPGSAVEELEKLDAALAAVRDALLERLSRADNETQRAILDAHLALLADVGLRARIEDEIRTNGAAAAAAVVRTAERFSALLRESGSAYLEERVLDLRDLTVQIVRALHPGSSAGQLAPLDEDAVCVAENLDPSLLMQLGRKHLVGIALAHGARTSHTVILARAFGIPCVTGLAGIERLVRSGQEVLVDGERGLVLPDPPAAANKFYDGEIGKLALIASREGKSKTSPGRTADGVGLEVAANVGSLEDARLAFEHGADGIGVFRTELLFMNRKEPPSEDEQALVYAEMARIAGKRPVIIRTLDIGGDKPIPYLDLPSERNPFLGYRAIRIYGDTPELIDGQVRAILRASACGSVRIMFPMVSSLEEVRFLRGLVARQMAKLSAAGIRYDAGIRTGIMVEIPSAAFVLDQLAGEADFFSVGSNDLAQYFMAAERGNERVAHLANPFHPAFLRLLKKIVDDAGAAGRWVGLCGELGGDLLALPLLAGMGFDEVSLASPGIAAVKSALGRYGTSACRDLVEAALVKETAAEVEALLRAFTTAGRGGPLVVAETVRLGSLSQNKEEAIRELVDLLHVAGRVDDPDSVEDAVWQREETSSTGIGFGFAIPHGKGDGVARSSIAAVRFSTPVPWNSQDDEPVRMAILIAVRAGGAEDEHLGMIAGLSRRLMDDSFRQALLDAGDAAAVASLLQGASGGS